MIGLGLSLPEVAALSACPQNVPFDMSRRFGIYVNSAADGPAYEAWLGAPADQVMLMLRRENWANFINYISSDAAAASVIGRPFHWSVPNMVNGTTLAQAAAGNFDAYYVQAAQQIVLNHNEASGPIVIRGPWEFNGGWQIWDSYGKEADFIGAWQRLVSAFRTISDRFRFSWCPNERHYRDGTPYDPGLAYPGDDYVDIIGMDVYLNAADWTGFTDIQAVWNYKVNSPTGFGMRWAADFAVAHGKRFALDEWGLCSKDPSNVVRDASYYVAQMSAFLFANNALYANYWESNSGKACRLGGDQYPLTGAEFRKQFGPPVFTSPVVGTVDEGDSFSIGLATTSPVPTTFAISGGPEAASFAIAGANLTAPDSLSAGDHVVEVSAIQNGARGLTGAMTFTLTVAEALWTPAAFGADLLDWWRADNLASLTTDGSNRVSKWISQTGNGRSMDQGSDAAKPIYESTGMNGGPCLSFNGTQHMTQTVITGLPAVADAIGHAALIHGDASLSSGFKYWFSDADASGAYRSWGSGNGNVRFQGSGSQSGISMAGLDVCVVHSLDAGASPKTSRLKVNGGTRASASVAVNTETFTRSTLGGQGSSGNGIGNISSLKVREIVRLKRAPTDAEVEKLEAYLCWQAGLASLLPSAHPYRNAAPTL
ncbi:glycosyl hydrolase [Flaviflagellibacter deserti]|uniref:Glycosyl hydrolase n=1 Tax=Flaviflagellibacter deserti TaxID=2267266 RepID=A0ABV9Z232_9HYPH